MTRAAKRFRYIGTTYRVDEIDIAKATCERCGREVWVGGAYNPGDRVLCMWCADDDRTERHRLRRLLGRLLAPYARRHPCPQ